MRIVNTIARWVEYPRARPPAWAEDVPDGPTFDGVDWIVRASSTRWPRRSTMPSSARRQKPRSRACRPGFSAASLRPPSARGHSQFISVAICELCFAQCVTTIANAKAKRAAGITDVAAPVERP